MITNNHLRSLNFLRAATSILAIALTATGVSFAQEGSKSDPDRAVTGGSFPAGWNVRPDRQTAANIKFSQAGDVYQFVMGPAGTFYRSDWTKSGNYTYSARLTQMAKPTHPISYGLMIGGSNLGTPTQTYTYFLVRNQGEFYIANWEGAAPVAVMPWTANAAIVKQGDDGKQSNTLGVQVQGDNVIFMVNGTEVARQPKSKVHADGMIGFRIGHNLDVNVDQVKR
jgi:hypothetical protein